MQERYFKQLKIENQENVWNNFQIFVLCYAYKRISGKIVTSLGYPFLLMLHIKFGFNWPSGFRGDDV